MQQFRVKFCFVSIKDMFGDVETDSEMIVGEHIYMLFLICLALTRLHFLRNLSPIVVRIYNGFCIYRFNCRMYKNPFCS